MGFGNNAAQIEAQTITTCPALTRRVAAVKWLGEKGYMFGSYTLAVVIYGNTCVAPLLLQCYLGLRGALGGVSQGIVQ